MWFIVAFGGAILACDERDENSVPYKDVFCSIGFCCHVWLSCVFLSGKMFALTRLTILY